MKKSIALVGCFIMLLLADFSCLPGPFNYQIIDIEIRGARLKEKNLDKAYNIYADTSVFTKDVQFIVTNVTNFASRSVGLVNRCYAYSPFTTIINPLIDDSFSLKFDRPFTYKNNIINADQNLLNVSELKNEIAIFKSHCNTKNRFSVKIIEFSTNLINNSSFESGTYQVTISCRSSDNRAFEKKISVEFKLQKN